MSFVALFFFLRRRLPPSFKTSTALASSGMHSYQIFKYLYTFPQVLSSKNIFEATTSQACSFLHCPETLLIVFAEFVSHSLSDVSPAGILGHVTWSSRPQNDFVTLTSSYCLHCIQPFSPSQITVKFYVKKRERQVKLMPLVGQMRKYRPSAFFLTIPFFSLKTLGFSEERTNVMQHHCLIKPLRPSMVLRTQKLSYC